MASNQHTLLTSLLLILGSFILSSCGSSNNLGCVAGIVGCFATNKSDSSSSTSTSTPTSTPPPSSASSSMTWVVTDQCNDGYAVDFRMYDFDRNLVWPATGYWYTQYYNTPLSTSIACTYGSSVCIGGATGNRSWGVGFSGNYTCSDCCHTCFGETVYASFQC